MRKTFVSAGQNQIEDYGKTAVLLNFLVAENAIRMTMQVEKTKSLLETTSDQGVSESKAFAYGFTITILYLLQISI